MKIEIAYGRDLDDIMLEQLLFMAADAQACYGRLDEEFASDGILIAIIPTETLSHFKRRVASTLFLMKTKKTKSGKKMLVGMACISKRGKSNCRFLHTVYVKPLHRKQGIGKALMKTATSLAKKSKFNLSLGVNPLNKVAMHLYESFGFKPCKKQSITMEFDGIAKK